MCSRPAVSKSACLTGWHQSSGSTERERKDKSQDLLTEWAAHLASSQPTCRAGYTNSTSCNQCSIELKLFPEYLNPLQESCDYTVCLRSFEACLRPRGVTSGHCLNSSVSSSRMMCFNNLFSSSLLRHPAQNCEVSEWSFWSGCAAPCTPSFRMRVREVERQPSHSGAPCPSLEQRSGCRDYRDHWGRPCGHKSGKQIIVISDLKSGKSNRFNSHQVLRSSPAWSLEKQGLNTITMETP